MKRKLKCVHSTLPGFTVGKRYQIDAWSELGYRLGVTHDNDGAPYHVYRDVDGTIYLVDKTYVRFA